MQGRSHCGACGHTLAARDLFPVLSWVATRGRCRYCGAKVSVRYPLSELAAAAVYVALVARFDVSWAALGWIGFFSILLAAAYADSEAMVVPGKFLLAAMVWRLLFLFVGGNIWQRLLQSVIGAAAVAVPLLLVVLLYERLAKKEAMGGGDLKLFAVIGFALGWQKTLLALIFSCAVGILVALALRKAKVPVPFAPAIVCGALLATLFGDPLWAWYMGLFGV
jgi:prepilin signal peptidase PulO-like enzyme (type II secretory pathway)